MDDAAFQDKRAKIQRLHAGILLHQDEAGTSPISRIAQVVEHPPEGAEIPDILKKSVALLQKPLADDATPEDVEAYRNALMTVLAKKEGRTGIKGVTTVMKTERKELGIALDPLLNLLTGQEVADDQIDQAISKAQDIARRRAERTKAEAGKALDPDAAEAALEKKARATRGYEDDDEAEQDVTTPDFLNALLGRRSGAQKPQGHEIEVLVPRKGQKGGKKKTTRIAAKLPDDEYLVATIPLFELGELTRLRADLARTLGEQYGEIDKLIDQKQMLQQVQGFIAEAKHREGTKGSTDLDVKVLEAYQARMDQPDSTPESATSQLPRELIYDIAAEQAKTIAPGERSGPQKALLQIYPRMKAYQKVVNALDKLTTLSAAPDTPVRMTMKEFGMAYAALVRLDDYKDAPGLDTRIRQTMSVKLSRDDPKTVATSMQEVALQGTGLQPESFVRMRPEMLDLALEDIPDKKPAGTRVRKVPQAPASKVGIGT